MTRPQAACAAIIIILAAAGLFWMNSFAPLQWPSVLAYSGIAIALCGVLSMLVPAAWLGFRRRVHSLLLGVLAGAILFSASWFWPVPLFTTPSPATRLDAFMPTYSFHERHELIIEAPAERVREALNHVTLTEIGVMQVLTRIRALAMGNFRMPPAAPSAPFLETMKLPLSGLFPLDDTRGEFIFGLAGQPWNNVSLRLKPEEFRAWAPPGNVKVAANFLIEDAGSGRSRVITETRVAATDEFARRKMARYWALIYPGSGMTRYGLLKAIQERAEHPGQSPR